MKRIFFSIVTLLLISSCNGLKKDFFEFLFNTPGISIRRDCSDIPSIFEEGRSFELYSTESVDINQVTSNLHKEVWIRGNKYSKYKTPIWKKTPVYITDNDTVYSFIHTEMMDKKNICFDENILIKTLQQKGNFFTILYDSLGKMKLFIWDTNHNKLYLLTSYDL